MQDTLEPRQLSALRLAGVCTIIMAATHGRQGTGRVVRSSKGTLTAVSRLARVEFMLRAVVDAISGLVDAMADF